MEAAVKGGNPFGERLAEIVRLSQPLLGIAVGGNFFSQAAMRPSRLTGKGTLALSS